MSLTHQVAFNTIVQIVGKIITTAISLILIAAITRYLGVSGYGQYTTIFAYVSFWSVLADFGFFWILVREISKPNAETTKIFNNIVTLRALIGVMIFTLAFIIAQFIPSYSLVVKLGIGVCAAGWFWVSLNSTYVGVFQSNLKMIYAVIGDVVGRAIILCLVLYFIGLHFSLNALIWAYFAGNVLNFILSMYFGRAFVHFRLSFDFAYWKDIFWEALPMGLVLISGILYFKTDAVMLSLFKSSQDVGIYGAPFKILEILLLIPGMFMGNVFPIITRYLAENDQRLDSAIQKSFDFLAIIAAPVVAGTLVTASQIIRFIAGEEFVTTATVNPILGYRATAPMVLQILIITVGIYFISQLFNNTIIAMGRQKDLVKPYLFFAAVNIGLNLIFIPWLSYIGAAIVTIITALLVLIFTAKIVFRYHPLKISYVTLSKAICSASIMALLLLTIKANLFVAIFVGIATYTAILYLLGGLSKEQLKSVLKG